MNPSTRRLPWTVGIGLLLLFLTLALAFLLAEIKSRVALGPALPVYNQVAGFTLTNQDGRAVSLSDLRGRVWVADIIFTRCAGPCLRMSRQMKELQDALAANNRVKLVSLTTDPDFDTPPVLKHYAERFGADPRHWDFLTGTPTAIHDLAAKSLKLSAVEKAPAERETPNDLFVHSTIFVIVDKRGQLRGVYQTGGEGVDWPVEKKKILAAARRLQREP